MDIKKRTTKHRTIIDSHNGSINIINKKSTTTEPPLLNGQQPKPPGGLNAFYWYQFFALDSAVVEVQEMLTRIEAFLLMQCIIIEKHSILIKSTYHDETKKRAQDSQIVKAKENLKLSHGGYR